MSCMFLISLLVVGLCVSGVISRAPFNFRQGCNVNHLNSTFSVTCDGSSKLITTKDLFLDSRSTASISEMNLKNFKNITIYSNVMVQKINISNTKNVSLYIGNTKLKELVIESVDVLTLKHFSQETPVSQSVTALVTLNNVNSLKFVNEKEGHFIWPINSMNISHVHDFALESLILNVMSTSVSIMNTNMRLENQSSLILKAVLAKINDTTIYVHDTSYFDVKVDNLSIVDSNIYIDNGIIKLFNSKDVVFFRNDLYGFENKSLLVSYSDVKFLNNNIFTTDIGNLLTFNRKYLTFRDNMFGCTDCDWKHKILDMDLKATGDENYCYTDCRVSLNTYKTMLKNDCVCNNSKAPIDYKLLCALCTLHSENSQTLFDFDVLQYILFASILVILTISIVCWICLKHKMRCFETTDVLPQLLERKESRDIWVATYTKESESSNENKNDIYESVGDLEFSR